MTGSPPSGGLGGKLLRACVYTLAGIALLGAAALAGLRILLPEIGHYRPEIEGWLSGIADWQVELGTIDAYWRGWTPVFRAKDVRLSGGKATDGGGTDPSIRLANLTFSIDPVESLRSGALQPREITASGASLTVVRRSDGALSVQELGELSPAEPHENDRLAQWMLSQESISLFASRILWIDEQRGMGGLPLTGVTLHLEHMSDRHRVSGAFELPEDGRIDFAMEVAGDSLTPSWTGAAYVAARDVDLDHLGLDARQLGAEKLSGVVSGTVWSTWQNARLVEAEGTIRAQSPGVMRGGDWRGFDEVSASFKVERTPDSWTFAARDLVVATSNGSWPRSSAGARWTPPRDGRDGTVVISAEFARIEDLVALASLIGELSGSPVPNTLIEAAPRGAIEDLYVSAPLTDRIELGRARARGRFTGLRLDPLDWPVSVDAANGRFEASGQGLVTNVASGNLHVSAPRWLAHPLRGEGLTGTVAAIPSPEGIRIRFEGASLVTPAGTLAAEGWVLAPRGGKEPELGIAFDLGPSKVTAVRALIAERVLPEPVSRWLEIAAPDGDIHRARLLLHGRLSELPFSAGTGKLEATAELALPALRYARGWPEITDVSGVVRFDGPRLDAHVASGRIFESNVREARITIEDLSAAAPVVQVAGRVEGTSANAVRFLAESPLRARFTPMIDTFAIHGDSTIDLGLTLPVKGKGQSITVEGKITLDDNRIDVPGLNRGPEAVNGVIAFRGAAVESDGITATWLGEPMRTVIGVSPESANTTRLSIEGRVTRGLLAAYLHDASLVEVPLPGDSALPARLHGDAAWRAILDIPRAGGGTPVRLRIATDLAGVSLDLPPPFGKASGTARVLSIESRITPGVEHITEVRHGGLANAVFRLVPDADRFRLDRGAVRLGTGDATLPDTPGVTVHGVLPVLDTGAWGALLEDITAHDTSSADASPFDHVREASIDAGSVTAIGARFPATRIRATRGADGGWRIDLAGSHLEGAMHLPRDLRAEPVTADFERFVFEPGSAEPPNERRSLDPRILPALSFSTRRFILGEYDLGHVRFTTAPSEHGMQLERLDVRADTFEGEATGSWSLAGAEHRTEFVMRMHGDDLGRMLGSLGFTGNAVTGGVADISLRGSWMDTPADFALERLTGVMHFLSTDGRLTRLERGVTGRVFGLLTITSLPRRLIFDFRDLFRNDFEYDRIEGGFAIENGHAHTDDLFMESDTARFEIVGRTGLVSEDYDKLVTVIPKISSSLPFVPLWLAQKILNRNVFDKAFAYQYTITGAWDEPVIELVKTQSRQSDGQE